MVNRTRDAFRLKIRLDGIEPAIWRDIAVPARYSFWDLHVAIQDAMGWLDYHLHEFRAGIDDSGEELVIGIPLDDDDLPYETRPGWQIALADVLGAPGDRLHYEYDFGDSWSHTIELLGIERREKGRKYPACLGGERACPPEDCGGVSGYQELLRVVFDPTDPDHDGMTRWLPPGWGPEVFDPATVRFSNPRARWRQAFVE